MLTGLGVCKHALYIYIYVIATTLVLGANLQGFGPNTKGRCLMKRQMIILVITINPVVDTKG